MFLEKIAKQKKKEVRAAKKQKPLAQLQEEVRQAPPVRPFLAGLKNSPYFPLIAEIKKASPSKGPLNPNLDVVNLAKTYEQGGAAALSVLTEEKFFGGSLADLANCRQAVSLPVLRKDFMVDAYQIWESRAGGADAVLLIADLLAQEELEKFYSLSHELGMEALVEVHGKLDLKKALALNPGLLGINNRDLKTFKTKLKNSFQLIPEIPGEIFTISESGIFTYDDLMALKSRGLKGALVGESLVTSPDPALKLDQLLGKRPSPLADTFLIKICGITSLKDARLAVEAGANALGFNFYPRSPRYITPEAASSIVKGLPGHVRKVGVFVDAPAPEVRYIAGLCQLDTLQFHGQESETYCGSFEQEVIKAFRVRGEKDIKQAYTYTADAFLLDNFSEELPGGTGRVFNWTLLKQARRPFILAGGLNPENIREAIQTCRPNGVDACSGVEEAPGRKSPKKLVKFVQQARKALNH